MPQAARSVLTVTLLGRAEAVWNGAPIDLLRRQTRALFYRLAIRPEVLSRVQLCFLFWPDVADATARRNLTRVLTHLRRALPNPTLLVTTPDSIALDAVLLHADTAAFEQLSSQSDGQPDLAVLEKAVALYGGPFLDGFSLPDCIEYEDWVDGERRAFERGYLQSLTALIDLKANRREYVDAIAYGRQYLEHDELDEVIHRRLIELYAASGDRGAAQRQYEHCTAILERELGVDPLPETRAAYQAALAERPSQTNRPVPALKWTTLPGLDLPLVGRGDALAQLERCYRQAHDGTGNVVLVSGEAGIGKSRLVQEFATRLKEEALVLAGSSQPEEHALPYHPIAQALRRGIHAVNGKLAVDRIWLAEASLVLPELHTLHPNLPAPLQTDPQQARTRLFESLTRITLALAKSRPLLLCLDDLHWADSASLDWLGYLAEHIRDSSLLVIGTYRQEEPDAVAALRHRLLRQGLQFEVNLTGLDSDAVYQLLHHADSTMPNGERLAQQLQQATGGNAFLLLETVRVTLEEHGTLGLLRSLDELPLSQMVTEAITARLRRLSSVARQILEAGAILGMVFSYELVQQTSGRSELEMVEGLDELVGRQLLREDNGFQFHHHILRRAVYLGITSWRRRLMHRRASEVLEAQRFDDVAVLAWHLEQAGIQSAKAVRYYLQSGNHALHIYAYQEANELFSRGLRLLDSLPNKYEYLEEELALHFGILSTLTVIKGFATAESTPYYERTAALVRQLGDVNQLYQVLSGLWTHHITRAEHEQALAYARQILLLAQEITMPTLLIEARLKLDESLTALGRLTAPSQSYTPAGYPLSNLELHPLYQFASRQAVDYFCISARLLWMWGYPDKGLRQAKEGLTHARATNEPFKAGLALGFLVMVHFFRGEPSAVQLYLPEVREIAERLQLPFLLAVVELFQGWVLLTQGNSVDAVAHLHSGIKIWSSKNGAFWLPTYLCMLAQAHAAAGDVDEALLALTDARKQIERTGECFWESEVVRLQGELLLQHSPQKIQEAESCFWQAVAVAQSRRMKSLELRAVTSLARLWQVQGKRQEAHEMLAEIYGWFTEGVDTKDLIEAKSLLPNL